jgi:hypothetical protein
MYSLGDFITHNKGVYYIMSIIAIGGLLISWEVSNHAPFRTVANADKQDIEYIKQTVYGIVMEEHWQACRSPIYRPRLLVMLSEKFAVALMIGGTNLVLAAFSRKICPLTGDPWRHTLPIKKMKETDKGAKYCS